MDELQKKNTQQGAILHAWNPLAQVAIKGQATYLAVGGQGVEMEINNQPVPL